MGEAKNGARTLHFDDSIKLEFRGAKVTTDAGLLAVRELDEVLRLTDTAGRPPKKPKVFYHDFTYRAGSRKKSRRVMAKVEWHSG